MLAADNLLLLIVIFPALKILHELGHAYATKPFGGEIHDVGVMLPGDDADAVRGRHRPRRCSRASRRALVGAAGMIVELFVAAIAMAVWISAEPGFVRSLAFNAILIASVSTVRLQRQPAAALRRLLHPVRRGRDSQLRQPRHAILGLSGAALSVRRAGRAQSGVGPRRGDPVPALRADRPRLPDVRACSASRTFVGSKFFFIGVLLAAWTVAISIRLAAVQGGEVHCHRPGPGPCTGSAPWR